METWATLCFENSYLAYQQKALLFRTSVLGGSRVTIIGPIEVTNRRITLPAPVLISFL